MSLAITATEEQLAYNAFMEDCVISTTSLTDFGDELKKTITHTPSGHTVTVQGNDNYVLFIMLDTWTTHVMNKLKEEEPCH